MSYCRFHNTAADLRDCAEHINDKLTGDHEPRARLQLIRSCMLILEAVGFEIDMHQEPVIVEDDGEDEYDDEEDDDPPVSETVRA